MKTSSKDTLYDTVKFIMILLCLIAGFLLRILYYRLF